MGTLIRCEFKCIAHGTVDCPTCFAWPALVVDTLRRQHSCTDAVFVNATVEQKLGVLAAMGIERPRAAVGKMKEVDVDELLGRAVWEIQPFVPKTMDVASLKKYVRPVVDAFDPEGESEEDSNKGILRPPMPPSDAWAGYADTLEGLLERIHGVARMYDQGHRAFAFQDKDTEFGIFMRVRGCDLVLST